MEFVKAHGTGNDFVVIPDLAGELELSAAFVRAVCDRHYGVGGDGVIRIAPGGTAPWRMDYRNADGSVAEMCGNGVRVVGKWLGDRGHVTADELDLETPDGVKRLELFRGAGGLVERVAVGMGTPGFERAALPMLGEGEALKEPFDVGGTTLVATCLSMGNPHAVVFVDDVEHTPVAAWGSALERHQAFPARTNVEFVQVIDASRVRQRTWERGCGETLACGTGACAVAVAAHVRGFTNRQVEVELRGGVLALDWLEDGGVRMTGPAREVAGGQLDPVFVAAISALSER